MAHRLSYAFTHGVQIGGLEVVRHTCDNPGSCNPNHLTTGNYAENSQDMVTKDRSAEGEQHGRAKLTKKEVLEIRKRCTNGEKQAMLAVDYGVANQQISRIVNNKRWSWL